MDGAQENGMNKWIECVSEVDVQEGFLEETKPKSKLVHSIKPRCKETGTFIHASKKYKLVKDFFGRKIGNT